MSWNYRILHHPEPDGGDYLALHEVYYDDKANPNGGTEEPIEFISGLNGQSLELARADLINSLEMALRDAREHPILDASAVFGEAP